MYSVEHIAEDTVTLKMLPEYRNKAETDAEVETVEAETADAETEETEETAETADAVSTAKEEVTVPLDDVAHVLRLTHAMCYYTVQGRTVRSHMVLLDTDHRHFSRRALIVGLSRATNGRLVHIPTEEEADVFTGGGAGHTEFVEISKWTLDRELPRYTKNCPFPAPPNCNLPCAKKGLPSH